MRALIVWDGLRDSTVTHTDKSGVVTALSKMVEGDRFSYSDLSYCLSVSTYSAPVVRDVVIVKRHLDMVHKELRFRVVDAVPEA